MAKTRSKKTTKAEKPEVKVEKVKAAKAPNQFTAEVDGEEKTFEITTPKFKLEKTVYSAEEAAANEKVCRKLIEIGAGNIKEILPEA